MFLSRGAQLEFSRCGVPAFLSWLSTFLKIVVHCGASGLTQVCKLWFGVSKGMLPVKHLDPQILMAVKYCGRQLAQRLVWAVPAYHKKEGATPHPGVWKHGLQCEGRPDGRSGVRDWMRNLGSVSGKGGRFVKN